MRHELGCFLGYAITRIDLEDEPSHRCSASLSAGLLVQPQALLPRFDGLRVLVCLGKYASQRDPMTSFATEGSELTKRNSGFAEFPFSHVAMSATPQSAVVIRPCDSLSSNSPPTHL